MPVLRRLKGWHALVMPNPAGEPHWSGLPWALIRCEDDPIRCEVCGGDKLTRGMDKTWRDRQTGQMWTYRRFCLQCSGNGDKRSDVNRKHCPKFKAAVLRAPRKELKKVKKVKEARKKANRPPTTKAKKAPKSNTKAVKAKEATRLSAK